MTSNYEFEIEALMLNKDGGKVKRKFKATYRKKLKDWTRFDYEIMEKYIGRLKGSGVNATLIEVKELE